jgi:hypothetical protein
VALQRGVALVPRRVDDGVRMIEVVDGVVEVDGDRLTGRELGDRLGRDADLILQVSYLTREDQARLADGTGDTPQPDVPPAEPRPTIDRPQIRSGDLVRIGGSVRVPRDERVEGDVVVVMGSADIDGEVEGEVTVVMGSLNLGPEAVVRDEVNVIGGSLNRQPGARIDGTINEVGLGGPGFRGPDFDFPNPLAALWFRVGNLAGTMFRASVMVLLALLVFALGRTPVERIADRTAVDPVRSGFVGLLAELLFIPLLVVVVVVLAVSIVGIPLLALVPFGVLAVGVLMIVGFTGLAYQLGRVLTNRFAGEPSATSPYLVLTVGVVAIMAVTILARLTSLGLGFLGTPVAAVGFAVEYLAWTIGFGATILAWFGARRGPVAPPPPLPTTT